MTASSGSDGLNLAKADPTASEAQAVIAALRQAADDDAVADAVRRVLIEASHPADALARMDGALAILGDGFSGARRAGLWLRWHDSLSASELESDYGSEVTIRLLESIAAAGDEAWLHLFEGDRAERVERAVMFSPAGVAVLEQLTFAPTELEFRAFAIRRLEELGIHGSLPRHEVRAIERLLHGSGEREAAYRVERARKRRDRSEEAKGQAPQLDRPEGRLAGLVVAIAGGHPALRRLIKDELALSHVSVREIPPAFEATRRERDIVATLNGCDVAILLIGQLAHTTSDQVRSVASRLSVPILVSPRASGGAVQRALIEWSSSRTLPS